MKATDPQQVHMDGTDPSAIARRSMSIFSRRGTETPERKPPFITLRESKDMTEKQKRWIRGQRCGADRSGSGPKGTILHAVPPAKTIQMTRLEEEMATSPNEEIMSAISGPPMKWDHPSPAQTNGFPDKSDSSPTQRTKSQQRNENNSRIGLWVNGVAHWDDRGFMGPNLHGQTGFTSPTSAPRPNASHMKPTLSVVIPNNTPDTSIPTIAQPMPRHPAVSVAPANVVSKFTSSSGRRLDRPVDDSSLERNTSNAIHPSERSTAFLYAHDIAARRRELQTKSRSSSSTSITEADDSSDYSQRSSTTSVEVIAAGLSADRDGLHVLATNPSKRKSPEYSAGSFDELASSIPDINKPLPEKPTSLSKGAIPSPSASSALQKSTFRNRAIKGTKIRFEPSSRTEDGHHPVLNIRASRSMSPLDGIDHTLARSTQHHSSASCLESTSPTEAAEDLQAHLSSITDSSSDNEAVGMNHNTRTKRSNSAQRRGSVRSVMQPPDRAPTLPKRSRKREWRAPHNARHSSRTTNPKTSPIRRVSASIDSLLLISQDEFEVTPGLRKAASASDLLSSKGFHQTSASPTEEVVPPPPKKAIDDGLIVVHEPLSTQNEMGKHMSTPAASAEDVLLLILSSLSSLGDLFNTAIINKGMYRVYKDNEMHLIRAVTYNHSPAAWELREWCPPGQVNDLESDEASLNLEHTPTSYMHSYYRDVEIIQNLKALILEHCATFIRRETVLAFASRNHPDEQRFDDAFWRIWSFCKIFGCGKDREEDVTGQLDWFKGGLIANNQELTATMNTNLEYDIGSVLLNPPDFFANGHPNGLSAEQLHDMTEIWACLTMILQKFHGRTDQARRHGIFDGCNVREGSEEEEQILEEWTAHLLTLGPAVVFEVAQFAHDGSSAGFALAKVNGWTKWTPLEYGVTRTTFLTEPVSRLYEERMAAAARASELEELSRKRVANMAAEMKIARQSSTHKHLPPVDTSIPYTRSRSTLSPISPRSQSRKKSPSSSRAPNFSVPRPQSPPPTLWTLSPIMEDRVENFNNRTSLHGIAEDTGERAVAKIVHMGFTVVEAREALRMTDMGDGLRVDRAVDLLLRQGR